MRHLQALCLVVLVLSPSAALTGKCPSPMMDLIDTATMMTMTCTDDAECEAAFPGYVCAPGTGGSFCCGAPGSCDANFVAIFEDDDFKDCTDCAAPAECQNEMCCTAAQSAEADCDEATEVEVAGECLPKVDIDAGACMDNAQCPPGSGATCSGDKAAPGTCKCPDAMPVKVNDICMAKATIGDPCLDTAQCEGGTCSPTTKKCECPPNNINDAAGACVACAATEVPINNVCEKMKNLGETCPKGVAQCPVGAICNRFCLCPAGFQANGPKDCIIATCNTNEVKVNDQCLPVLPPNGFLCYYQEQCSGGSTCVDFMCTCPAAAPTVVNNACTGTGTVTTTAAPMCTGNTVRIGTQCMAKTTDGVCLNVNCLSTGNAGCANYAPYQKCGYNAAQKNYFCCP
uniref:EB domain-containing protein n=1 Tax=Plectus sambesii TaxID=2011161 RepID=A0A914WPC8_9BILA